MSEQEVKVIEVLRSDVKREILSIMMHTEHLKKDNNRLAPIRVAMLAGKIDLLENLKLVTKSGCQELRSIVEEAEKERLS